MRRIVIGQPVVDWVAKTLGRGEAYGLSIGIGMESDGVLIGGVVYNEWNHANINMHAASDGSGHWITKRLLWMAFDYPFNQLKVKRITAFIEDDRKEAIAFDNHLGFQYEFTMKDAHPLGDIIVMVMRREDCRWLNLQNRAPLGIAA